MSTSESTFLDLLYDAAVDPDRWVAVMERFADLTGGTNAWLSRLSIVDGSGAGLIARIDPDAPSRYQRYYGALNPFANAADPRAYMERWRPGVLTDEDCLPKDALVRSEYFNDFMRPNEADSCMIVRLSAHQFETCALTINRPARRGRFERADVEFAERLRPHVRRAFHLTEKLSEAGLRSPEVETALDRSPFGIFVLDATGGVRRTNRTADRILAQRLGLCVLGGRLCGSHGPGARRLDQLIAQAGSPDAQTRTGGSMSLRVPGRATPLSIFVTPVQAARSVVFGHAPGVLVCVTDPENQARATAGQLQDLFGFTPAEARVALALLDGVDTREAAARLGVSFHTVRHQVQSMLDKTGAARQAELVALLLRATAGPLG